MSVDSYGELLAHVGHEIKCVTYGEPGDPQNVAIECETCSTVLIDYNRPHRFIVVARFEDHSAGDYIGLIPITLPDDELTSGPATAIMRYSAVAHTIHKERWQIVTDTAGEPIFFPEGFAAFHALWALTSNPQAYDDIIALVTRLVAYLKRLDDEEVSIIEPEATVATHLDKLRDAVDTINI
jgi:hypothetical protein